MGALRRKFLDGDLRPFEIRSFEVSTATFDSAEVVRYTQQDSSYVVQGYFKILLLVLFVSQQFPTFVIFFSFPPLSSQLNFMALDGVNFVTVSSQAFVCLSGAVGRFGFYRNSCSPWLASNFLCG